MTGMHQQTKSSVFRRKRLVWHVTVVNTYPAIVLTTLEMNSQ